MGEAKRRRDAGVYPNTSTPPPARIIPAEDATAPLRARLHAWFDDDGALLDPEITRPMRVMIDTGHELELRELLRLIEADQMEEAWERPHHAGMLHLIAAAQREAAP